MQNEWAACGLHFKTFTGIINQMPQQARVFVTVSDSHPYLIFADNPGTYMGVH